MVTSVFLLINGPGKWSLDAVLQRSLKSSATSARIQESRVNLPASAAD